MIEGSLEALYLDTNPTIKVFLLALHIKALMANSTALMTSRGPGSYLEISHFTWPCSHLPSIINKVVNSIPPIVSS